MQRTIVVSGGGTGIGLAIAQRFASEGSRVVLLGRRSAVLTAAVQQINKGMSGIGACTVGIPIDLTLPHEVEDLPAMLVQYDIDTVDVLINNAGGVWRGDPEGLHGILAQWTSDFHGNVMTAVLLTEALLPRIREGGGRIISMSSIAAVNGGGNSYSAAKAALVGWTYHLARMLGPRGITVNCIAPGYVQQTEFFGSTMTPERHQRLVAQTVVGRAGIPEDIAATAFFLASGEAGYISGQLIHVNGGAGLGR
jgi:3-oxoacyl-[acyl-carrier protein] reductase